MCIPKRTPSQQRAHEATMRAINRGKRNHPRHHNLRPAVYALACLACAAFGASVVFTAAFFTTPPPSAQATTTLPRSVP